MIQNQQEACTGSTVGRVFTDAAEQEKSESAKGTRLELRQSHPIGIMYKLGILCRTDSKMQEDSRV